MKVIDVPQGSPAWFAARLGRLTSSTANAMLAKPKGAIEDSSRYKLALTLALERINGRPMGSDFTSKPMENGKEREPDAFGAYEALTGTILQRVGFIAHDDLMAGASLDAYMGARPEDAEAIVEIKCPGEPVHFGYVQTGKVPTNYMRQITHQFWMVPTAQYAEFASFHPAFPGKTRLKVVRVNRADVDLAAYELAVRLFLGEVDALQRDIEAKAA